MMPLLVRPLAVVSTLVALWAAPEPAQAQAVEGRVPVSVIDGRLVVACDLSTPFRRIPVNLFVEYEGAFGLQLHNKAAAPLRCENPDGSTIPIRIHMPDFDLEVPRRELGDEDLLDEFTKYHSEELGENAIVGSIGAEVLRQHLLTFDLANGFLEFAPLPERSPDALREETLEDGSVRVRLSEQSGLLWLPVRLGDGAPSSLAVGCAHYDSRVEARECRRMRHPAGDLGPVRIGPHDLSLYVAWRPEDVNLVHPDGALGVLGVNLLEHFRLQVDPANRSALLTPTVAPDFPAADLAFFRARVEEDPEELEAFLTAHPGARLGHEAAELLLAMRFDEGAGPEDTGRALRWIHDTTLEDLRTTRLLDLMKELTNGGHLDEVLLAGELAVDSGRDDRYPNAVHEVHGRMGRLLLDREQGQEAWGHLLSAAFGLPQDGPINLDLGRYYESQGRHRRAFSRYVQAVLSPDSGPEALEAMARVQPMLDPARPFGADVVERMIAGKVRSFGSASRYVPDDQHPARRVVLCEFFTNAWLGTEERGGAIGGALGNEGLLSHFGPEHVVFLSHHLPSPQVDPLCSSLGEERAALLGVGEPVVHVVDGVSGAPGAGKWRDGEAIYSRTRGTILERLAQPSDFSLLVEATLEPDPEGRWVLRGEFLGDGPSESGLSLHLVLAERGVVFPGRTGVVIHRNLARAELTPRGGLAWDPVDGGMSVPFEVRLEDLDAAQDAYLDELLARGVGSTVRVSTHVDPQQVVLVGWVEDDARHEVLCATQGVPVLPAPELAPTGAPPDAADGDGEGTR